MIELLITIFTGGGAVGLGSIFKMVAGAIESSNDRKELKERRKILAKAGSAKEAMAFQKVAFGTGKGGSYSRHTRRFLALIGVSTLAIGTIHCTLFPADQFITLASAARNGASEPAWSLGWGLFTIYRGDTPIQLTLGHLAMMNYVSLCMILGYYFTPGGRARG